MIDSDLLYLRWIHNAMLSCCITIVGVKRSCIVFLIIIYLYVMKIHVHESLVFTLTPSALYQCSIFKIILIYPFFFNSFKIFLKQKCGVAFLKLFFFFLFLPLFPFFFFGFCFGFLFPLDGAKRLLNSVSHHGINSAGLGVSCLEQEHIGIVF